MKTTKILAALAGVALFTACQEEELVQVQDVAQEMEEVVGAKLIGTDVSMNVSMGTTATRWAGGESVWEAEDIVGLGWVVNTSAATDQESTDAPTDSRLFANHKYNYDEQAKTWSTYGNLYQGWHFAYYPWNYMPKVAQKVFEVNPVQTTADQKLRYSERLFISSRKFIDASSIDPETNVLTTQFEMLPAVKTIRVKTNPAAESSFAKVEQMKNLSIDYIEFNTGDDAVTPFAKKNIKLYAKNVPAHNVEKDYAELMYKNFYGSGASVPSYVFDVQGYSSTLTTTLGTEDTKIFKASDNTRIITYAVPATATLNTEVMSIKIGVGNGAGYFLIDKNDEKNKAVLETLANAYKADGAMAKMNSADASGAWALDLSIELYDDIFKTDFTSISNIDEWNAAVNLVNILGRESETFGIDSTIVFTDSIYMPTNCELTVVRHEGAGKYTQQHVEAFQLAGNFKDFTWPAKLNSNDVRVYVAEGAEVDNAHTIVTRQIWNYGTLNVPVGGKAAARYTVGGNAGPINYGTINLNGMYAEAKNVTNNKGTINLVYGAFVSLAPSTEAGKIAYIVTNEDVKNPTRIQNVINDNNKEGEALVNTLKFLSDSIQAFNFTQSIGGTEGSDDPYNPSTPKPSKPETLQNLGKVNLEIDGVRVVSDEAVTVKSVYMENNDSLRNISITNGLTVKGHGAVVCATIAGGVTTDGNVTAESITGNVIANGSTIEVEGTIADDINVENSTITAASITGNVVAKNSTITLTGDITGTVNCEGTAIEAANITGDINAKGGSIVTTGNIANVTGEGTTFEAAEIKGTVNLNGGSIEANVTGVITVTGGDVTANNVNATSDLNVNAGTYTINAEAETKYANIVVAKNAELFVNQNVVTSTINVAGKATVAEDVTLYYTTAVTDGGFKHTGTTTGNFEYRAPVVP